MNLLKGSLQDELDLFFKNINSTEFEERYVSKAAFSKARANLSHTTFIDANENLVNSFYEKVDYRKWNGFRLTAIDGSTLKLPPSQYVSDHFGRRIPSEVPQAKISSRFDVLNKVCLELLVDPWNGDERNMAHRHLEHVENHDLILYDRGYPCFSLYADHKKRNSQFVMRLAKNWSKETIAFETSNARDKTIEIYPHRPETKQRCLDNNVSTESVKVRLLKVKLPTGEDELLITSLLDKSAHPLGVFKDLYSLRWGIEEDYKTKKVWMEYENFSGKSAESVLQDIFAKMYAQNIVAVISFAAKPLIDKNCKDRKYEYQTNQPQALSKIKNNLFKLTKRSAISLMTSLIHIFSITIEPIRPNRKEKRKHKIRKRTFYPQYKTIR
ncbi:hypothetical protein LCGC14_2057010 [marine sediment metagenome]|uniref:Transposase IS4-like domain-containing protein n=1 Tax=marine sediment metagenome TaxID=412755 RepID=A0A0F9EME0_9ZZZZ